MFAWLRRIVDLWSLTLGIESVLTTCVVTAEELMMVMMEVHTIVCCWLMMLRQSTGDEGTRLWGTRIESAFAQRPKTRDPRRDELENVWLLRHRIQTQRFLSSVSQDTRWSLNIALAVWSLLKPLSVSTKVKHIRLIERELHQNEEYDVSTMMTNMIGYERLLRCFASLCLCQMREPRRLHSRCKPSHVFQWTQSDDLRATLKCDSLRLPSQDHAFIRNLDIPKLPRLTAFGNISFNTVINRAII